LDNDDVLLKVLRLEYYKKYLHCHFSEISKLELGLTLKSLLNNAIKFLIFSEKKTFELKTDFKSSKI